jgi:integrase
MARKKRVNKGTWKHSVHDILDGMAQIYRVAQSGDVWQFRMWVEDEKKYVRKSLRTRDLETALEEAKTKVFQTMSDVKSGRKIFGSSLQELADEFLKWRAKDVTAELITPGRLKTIESQLKHFLGYKGQDLKFAELNRNSYYNYEVSRRTEGAQPVTIRNEQSTINQMIAFGYREGLTHFDKLDFRKLRISGDEIGRRDTFTLEEYDQLVRYLRTYVSKKACPDATQRLKRQMIRDAILIASNTLLRVGELWQLRWSDIQKIEKINDTNGRPVSLVTINVRKEICKTRKERTVISRGGEYIERLRANSEFTGPEHFLFTNADGTKRFRKEKWYAHWKDLMLAIGIEDYQQRKLTYYSLRHFGCSCRIRAGNRYSEIATMMGCSVTYIEHHYGHIDEEMKKSAALKNFSFDEHGILVNQ